MKADRLLSALLLLQAHGQMTGRALAERLEVSERTVHRDMEALSAAGVPVFAMRGANGGWQLQEDWRTEVPGLDEAELRALLMAQPRVIGDVGLAAAAERAFGKLMAALPCSMRERAISIRQRLHVDTSGWHASKEDLSMLPLVQDAVSADRKLSFVYCQPGKERGKRVVDPLGLVAKGNTWYLVAGTPNGLRTYRISRMDEAKLLDAPCKRPANFDLALYWKQSTAEFAAGWKRLTATLRVEPRVARQMKMWSPWMQITETENSEPDGWPMLRAEFSCPEEALFIVMGFGAGVEVIEPESLRERVASQIAALIERMRGHESVLSVKTSL
jgi:predicted DNA-binding transcriptional regulator YafY